MIRVAVLVTVFFFTLSEAKITKYGPGVLNPTQDPGCPRGQIVGARTDWKTISCGSKSKGDGMKKYRSGEYCNVTYKYKSKEEARKAAAVYSTKSNGGTPMPHGPHYHPENHVCLLCTVDCDVEGKKVKKQWIVNPHFTWSGNPGQNLANQVIDGINGLFG